MVSIHDAILVLVPTATFGREGLVTLVDDGSGPVITRWDKSLGSQPSAKDLAAVTEQQVSDYQTQQKRIAAKAAAIDPGPVGVALRAAIISIAKGEITASSSPEQVKKAVQDKIDTGVAD